MGIIDPTVVDQLKTVSHLQITDYGISAIIYLFYQLDPAKPASKFFSDRRVRQALLYGLDREKMAQALFFGAAAPGQSVIPSVTWAYDANVTPKYTFDKAKAEQLLDDAGWKKGASGVREKSGVPLKFELMGATGSKPLENAVVSIQEQWKAIGVEVAPKMVDSNTISNVSTNTREYDAMVSQRNMPQDPDPSLTWSSGNAAPGGFNTTGYKNPDVDKLIESAAAVFDQEQRKKIYSQFQNLMATEVPGPPLFVPREIVGVNKRVQGVVGTLGTFNRLRRTLWFKDVWVTDGK
jgi:peptide/nickel transport system substrate-binding protein